MTGWLLFKFTEQKLFSHTHTKTQLFHHSLIWQVLKVRNLSGEWISAPPIPGAFVCNIGDMLKVKYPWTPTNLLSISTSLCWSYVCLNGLQIYSNGLYESTLHQVINNSTKFRVSVAYFYEVNLFSYFRRHNYVCYLCSLASTQTLDTVCYYCHLVLSLTSCFCWLNLSRQISTRL